MIYPTDVLSDIQLDFLSQNLPSPQAREGRPAYSNRELLPGIVKVLRSGCRWRDLNLPGYPDGTTHWRRMRFWKKKRGYNRVWKHLLRLLYTEHKLNLTKVSLDGSLIDSFEFKEQTGYSGKDHKTGTKISTLTDAQGIPLSLISATGNTADISLAEETVDEMLVSQGAISGATFLADRGYDSFDFRVYLTKQEMFPHIKKRSNTKVTQKNSWYYIYDKATGKWRFVIERTNGWIKDFRRLRNRFDYTIVSFEALLLLAVLVICIRKLMS